MRVDFSQVKRCEGRFVVSIRVSVVNRKYLKV